MVIFSVLETEGNLGLLFQAFIHKIIFCNLKQLKLTFANCLASVSGLCENKKLCSIEMGIREVAQEGYRERGIMVKVGHCIRLRNAAVVLLCMPIVALAACPPGYTLGSTSQPATFSNDAPKPTQMIRVKNGLSDPPVIVTSPPGLDYCSDPGGLVPAP